MAYEVAERGLVTVTVARVIARAGVSRRAFYQLFTDVEDCLLATLDWALELARARVLAAVGCECVWREAMRSGLAALLRFFDENAPLARLCVVHATAGGPRVLERRAQALGELREAVEQGRRGRTLAREPSPVVAEGVVGGVMAVLYSRLLARGAADGEGESQAAAGQPGARQPAARLPGVREPGESGPRVREPGVREPGVREPGESGPRVREPGVRESLGVREQLIELHGQLMSLIVLPYMGANAAARELQRPAPAPPIAAALPEAPASARVMLDLPHGRLTYRTVRVLRAIAECPGGSNRDVAKRAGIVDQGQISKALVRLQEQDLVVNRGGRRGTRGTPNAWWLTERGASLEAALRETPASGARARPTTRRPAG